MATTLRESPARNDPVAPPPRHTSVPGQSRPIRDNTVLLLIGVGVLIAALVSLLALASRSATLAPDFLTEVVLYALSATNLTILVALAFVLARNIVKLLVEKRRGLPFAHFRAKLVAVLLGMTLIPALLVLLVGSGLIRNSVDRWFNAPMDDVLSSANAIAGDHYEERQRLVAAQAGQLARALAGIDVSASSEASVRAIVEPDVLQERVSLVEVYRAEPVGTSDTPVLVPVVGVGGASMPSQAEGGSADRLAAGAAAGAITAPVVERLADGGDLIRSAVPIRASPGAPLQGVVIASEYVTGQFAARARRMTEAYEDYQQLRVLQRPLAGVYLSFFFMLTLMILIGSTWMGLYLAKRITRPVQMLAVAANEIGAGRFDHRVEAETRDEFGSLIDAFNRMASDLSTSRRRLERSAIELEAEAPRCGGAAPVRRDDPATHCYGCRLSGHGRQHPHDERSGVEIARCGRARCGPGSVNRVRLARAEAAGDRDGRGVSGQRRCVAAGGVDHARRPRHTSGGHDDAATTRGRSLGRRCTRTGGRDAPDSRTAGCGVARGGASPGP